MKQPWFHIVCELDDSPVLAPTIADILRATCARFHVRLNELLSSRRVDRIAVPRHVAMYLARTLTRKSFPTIARAFGGMDHTTIIFGTTKIERVARENGTIARHIDAIAESLGCANPLRAAA